MNTKVIFSVADFVVGLVASHIAGKLFDEAVKASIMTTIKRV